MASVYAWKMAGIKLNNEEENDLLEDKSDDAKSERSILRQLTANKLKS